MAVYISHQINVLPMGNEHQANTDETLINSVRVGNIFSSLISFTNNKRLQLYQHKQVFQRLRDAPNLRSSNYNKVH